MFGMHPVLERLGSRNLVQILENALLMTGQLYVSNMDSIHPEGIYMQIQSCDLFRSCLIMQIHIFARC